MNYLDTPTQPYPIDAFYVLMGDAAKEVTRNIKAPDGLVGIEFLVNSAAVVQGLYDVQLPTGQLRPVSLAAAVIAPSGERATAVHNRVASPLYEFDAARMAKYEVDFAHYERECTAWKAIEAGLVRALTKAAKEGEPTETLSDELKAWAQKRPTKPRARRLLRHNMSERAIMETLEGDGEAVAFITDEGDILIKGGLLEKVGLFNKAWDGAHLLTYDRSNGVSLVIRNPRVTVAYKLQPEIFKDLLARRGDVMRGSGHWARYLIGAPASTQGTRFTYSLDQVWEHLPKFHARMWELLEELGRRTDAGRHARDPLVFCDDAKRLWLGFQNQVENMLSPPGYMQDMKDFASKSMEIMGRIAALLHVVSGQEGQISADSLDRAMKIVEWHIHEFKRIFAPQSCVQQAQLDAQTLGQYLYRSCWCASVKTVAKNAVLRNGPVRPSKRFEEALALLVGWDHVRIVPGPKQQRFIELNPQVFGAPAPMAA